jgi:hypothetical protein
MKKQCINIFTKIYPVSKEDIYEDGTVADKEDSTRAKVVVCLAEIYVYKKNSVAPVYGYQPYKYF